MPNLKELYLTDNKIKTVQGLEGCPSLVKIHLRKNIIEVFDENFPVLESLKYLNLRENKIEKMDEIAKLVPLV
jgi:Leucine-rich repeat (LRR) protein